MAERSRNRQGCGQPTTVRNIADNRQSRGKTGPPAAWIGCAGRGVAQHANGTAAGAGIGRSSQLEGRRLTRWVGESGVALSVIAGWHSSGQRVGHLVDSSSKVQ